MDLQLLLVSHCLSVKLFVCIYNTIQLSIYICIVYSFITLSTYRYRYTQLDMNYFQLLIHKE